MERVLPPKCFITMRKVHVAAEMVVQSHCHRSRSGTANWRVDYYINECGYDYNYY